MIFQKNFREKLSRKTFRKDIFFGKIFFEKYILPENSNIKMLGIAFFIGKLHNSLKGVVGLAMGVASILTFAGVLCSCAPSIVAYFIGGVLAAGAIYTFFDVWGVQIVQAAVREFEQRIDRLDKTVDHLENVRDDLQLRVTDITSATEKYKLENEVLAQRTQEYKLANLDLSNNIQYLSAETNNLKQANMALALVQENAKKLISSLMTSGDKFNNFGEILRESLDHLDDTNTSMERLLINLKRASFQDIDTDKNGLISKEELNAWVGNKQ